MIALHPHAEHHRPAHLAPEAPSRFRLLRHGARVLALALAGHFAMHTGWYTFEHLTHWSGIDPKDLAGIVDVAGPIAAPLAAVLVALSAWAEDRLH